MTGFARRPVFWIAYAALAAASLALAAQLFPHRVSRSSTSTSGCTRRGRRQGRGDRACGQARAGGARSVARFANDATAQNYVELEGGGKAAFAQLVAGRAYAPYWWEVRLFKPGEVDEATVRFRPDGTPERLHAAAAGDLRAGPFEARARCRRRARTRAHARTRRLGRRLRRLSPARAVAADAADRPGRPRLRVRARRQARRRPHPAAARGRGRRPGRVEPFVHVPERSTGATRKCAARTTRSRRSRASRPAPCTALAAASSARCGCCAATCCCGGRR